ncbi:MAG: type II toxin-antitoxin system RelE/ParE family toxin [Dongiaceae bacterium]
MRRYGLTPAAENDLAAIFEYIAERNPGAADRVLNALIGPSTDWPIIRSLVTAVPT